MGSVGIALTREELKRLAIQIAAQLPERQEDALSVLEFARKLVMEFLDGEEPASDQGSGS